MTRHSPAVSRIPFVYPMKFPCRHAVCVLFAASATAASHAQSTVGAADCLVNPAPYKAKIVENKASGDLVLENGLARRVIRLGPNAATTTLQNLTSGEHLIRAVSPEARVTLNGTDYPI